MALLFNGTNQGLNTSSNSLAQNVSQCTCMAWIYVPAFPSVSGGIIQINTNSTSTSSRINLLLLNNGALRIGGRASDSMPTISSVDSVSVVTRNAWYHVVGMIDYATETGYIYINGVQSTTTGVLSFTASVTDNTSSYAFNLGSDENNIGEFCNVAIDDARVYHRVLSESEIQTIYACKGTDSVVQDLQTRWMLVGPENETPGTIGTISIANVDNASSTSNSSSLTLSSYTAPVGSNLVLVVAATAESTNSGRVLASNISFNGTNLTQIASVRTTTSSYNGVSLWSRSITSGESGDIVVDWSGNNSRKTMFAYVLINAQSTVEATATSFSNTGITTTGLTTISDGSVVVTACANEDGFALTAVGTNHVVDSTLVASTHAGAIGHVNVPVASSITGIGFTASPVPNGEALVLAAFAPSRVDGQITELSNNEIVGTALNGPIYQSNFLKFRRSLTSQG
jgi:hypothetical protein